MAGIGGGAAQEQHTAQHHQGAATVIDGCQQQGAGIQGKPIKQALQQARGKQQIITEQATQGD